MKNDNFINEYKKSLKLEPELFEAILFLSEMEKRDLISEDSSYIKSIRLPRYQTNDYPIDAKFHKSISRCLD